MSRFPSPVVVGASTKAKATVIMLHGLGDTGNGWADVPRVLDMPWIKWVFPTAKTRPVTINMGAQMPAWFDVSMGTLSLEPNAIDREGIQESVSYVRDIVQKEVEQGIPLSRVVLGGFSQGGNIAVHAAMEALQGRIAGCMGLSTFIDVTKENNVSDPVRKMPIALFHGTGDPVVPFQIGKLSYEMLKAKGMNVEFKQYPGMGHTASMEELMDLKQFLLRVLPENETPLEKVTAEQVDNMSVGELKAFLSSRSIQHSDCFEKNDLKARAKSQL
eukprot:jgi/Pico_ML_1/52365/g3077.t1